MNVLSLVIPVYNESIHLHEFLSQLDILDVGIEKELIIVNDKSTDGSEEILNQFNFKSKHLLLHQPKNLGKGACLKIGIQHATGTFVCIQDADFEYDMADLQNLIQPLLENKADIVYGSRFKKSVSQVHRTFHYLINRFLTLMSNFLSGLYLTDMETCYKLFKSEIIKNTVLESKRFGFEPEITAKIAKLKCRVHEIPISYFPRNYIEGKKITWKDGLAAVRHIIYFNFFRSIHESFSPQLPKKYIPQGSNWL